MSRPNRLSRFREAAERGQERRRQRAPCTYGEPYRPCQSKVVCRVNAPLVRVVRAWQCAECYQRMPPKAETSEPVPSAR
jgi:hypothetical protein